jgi:hypothetical protein
MRWCLLAAPVLAAAAAIGVQDTPPETILVFTGDLRGYLAPCGCADPKIGGIRRIASVAKSIKLRKEAVFVDIGNWTMGSGRQDQLKAEAIAESFRSVGADYLNIGALDLRFGADYLRSLDEATKGALQSSSAAGFRTAGLTSGGAWICGLLDERDAARGTVEATWDDALAAVPAGKSLVVLFAGNRERATELAKAHPEISLIVYTNLGDPHKTPVRVGNTLLVTPGDKGRFVGWIELSGGEWKNFRTIELGPEHRDDTRASEAYTAYLRRVTDERLIERVPRSDKGRYVGSQACASCHAKAYEVWADSDHFIAMPTLEKIGHDRDPDCVGCHVVGLDATTGFRDVKRTPSLAGVGCESCHGPGATHLRNTKAPYGRAGSASCSPCHNRDHSPNFSFREYWEKIRH